MRIATWNVNSVRARLPNLLKWLNDEAPDVALLQELKCQDNDFPTLEIQAAGYHAAVHGQKSYNGVAILAKSPLVDVRRGFPEGEVDEPARYIEATVQDVRVASLYLPNGNPAPGEKYEAKLRWMQRLVQHVGTVLRIDAAVVLGGDYNVCPTDDDVYAPERWKEDALCRPEARALFRTLCHLGMIDALHALHPEAGNYTFWDYQAGAWQRDQGLRIDHLLLSPQAADRLKGAGVHRDTRGWEKASDHAPVWVEIESEGVKGPSPLAGVSGAAPLTRA